LAEAPWISLEDAALVSRSLIALELEGELDAAVGGVTGPSLTPTTIATALDGPRAWACGPLGEGAALGGSEEAGAAPPADVTGGGTVSTGRTL